MAARKELQEGKFKLQAAIHRAIQTCRPAYEQEFNDLLEKAWVFYQSWKNAIDSVYYENGSSPGPYLHAFFNDQKRHDFIIRGQY